MKAVLPVVALLWLTGCAPKERQVSGPLKLGPEWVELRPNPPQESVRQRQILDVEFVGVKADFDASKPGPAVLLLDDKPVRFDVEVVDDAGTVFKQQVAEQAGNTIGFSTVFDQRSKQDPPPYLLSPDHRYPIIRLRSERAADVAAVRWLCVNNK